MNRLVKIFFPLVLLLVAVTAAQAAAPTAVADCSPTEVAVYHSRIHIRCAEGIKDGAATITFWAVSTRDAQWANRFLSLGSTALVSGRHMRFTFTPGDTSGTAFGCLAQDCRTPSMFSLW